MKHLSKLLIAALLFVGYNSIQAQDMNNPWQVSFGVNAIDTYPTSDGSSFGNEFFNVNDHWNIVPSISYIGLSKYIGSGFSVGARGSLNKINKIGDTKVDDLSHYAIDGTIKYSFITEFRHRSFYRSRWRLYLDRRYRCRNCQRWIGYQLLVFRKCWSYPSNQLQARI